MYYDYDVNFYITGQDIVYTICVTEECNLAAYEKASKFLDDAFGKDGYEIAAVYAVARVF